MSTTVLSIGRPIGTTSVRSRQGCQVTSTVASVGPYRLCSSASGSAAAKRWTRCAVNGSPMQNTRRRLAGAVDLSTASRNAASSDGTNWTTPTRSRLITSSSRSGSRCAPASATTSVAPAINGQNNSGTDTSNVTGVFSNTRSPTASGNVACRHRSSLTTAR